MSNFDFLAFSSSSPVSFEDPIDFQPVEQTADAAPPFPNLDEQPRFFEPMPVGPLGDVHTTPLPQSPILSNETTLLVDSPSDLPLLSSEDSGSGNDMHSFRPSSPLLLASAQPPPLAATVDHNRPMLPPSTEIPSPGFQNASAPIPFPLTSSGSLRSMPSGYGPLRTPPARPHQFGLYQRSIDRPSPQSFRQFAAPQAPGPSHPFLNAPALSMPTSNLLTAFSNLSMTPPGSLSGLSSSTLAVSQPLAPLSAVPRRSVLPSSTPSHPSNIPPSQVLAPVNGLVLSSRAQQETLNKIGCDAFTLRDDRGGCMVALGNISSLIECKEVQMSLGTIRIGKVKVTLNSSTAKLSLPRVPSLLTTMRNAQAAGWNGRNLTLVFGSHFAEFPVRLRTPRK